MDFSCFNAEIATRPGPWPELSYALTEEELDDLWFFYILEFGYPLDIPVYQNVTPGHLPSSCTTHPSFNYAAPTPPPATSMGGLTDLIAQSPYTYPDVIDDWPLPAQSLMETNFVAPDMPTCNSPWTGMAPFAAHSLTATHSFMPMQASGSSETGPVVSEYEAIFAELNALLEPTSCPAASSISATTSVSGVAHGKRHRNAGEFYGDVGPAVVENYEGPPLKRVRGEASGGMEAAQSTARTRRRPETRVPTIKNNTTSKEAGRGAERLATPNAQGVYHHSLPGPSSQQGRVLTNAQGPQLPWVEERVEEASHHMANAVQQEEGHLFQIPSNFHEGYMILLAATEADWTRRAVDEIVPTVGSQNGMISSVTARPQMRIHLKSHFRHRNRPSYECLDVTPERAEEKRRETEREHSEFMGRVERSLTTGEEIGTPFAQIIKRMYPESSKKRTGSGW